MFHRAGDLWVDLRPELVTETSRGLTVMWVSFSGTVQFFDQVDGQLARLRVSRGSHFFGDGEALLVLPPFVATACGFADASGYRSTPPLLVSTIDRLDDVEVYYAEAMAVARQLAADGFDPNGVPTGHPANPCGAIYCPRITPEAVLAE